MLSLYTNFHFLEFYVSGLIQYVLLFVGLSLPIILKSTNTVVHTKIVYFCCWKALLCRDVAQFVYSFVCWWRFVLHLIFALTNRAALNICTLSLCGHIFLFLLGKYLGLKQLSHIIHKYLTVWETAKMFSKVVVPSYVPTSSVWVFWLSASHQQLIWPVVLILATSDSTWWF